MIANIQLENDSPPRWFLDPGGQNREVRLPAIEKGMEYTVFHAGIANTLTIKDFDGVTICTINTGELAMLFAGTDSWLFIAGSNEIGAPGGGIEDAYTSFTDGTNTSASDGSDTFKFRTGSLLTATVTDNHATHGDNLLIDFASGTALSVLGVTGNAAAIPAYIQAAADGQVLRRAGTALEFGQVSLGSANAVTGTLGVGNGGTGQTTVLAAFNALSPLTTKGDILTRDATNNIRVPVGTDTQVLSASSGQASGLLWVDANDHVHDTGDITGLVELIEDTVGAQLDDTSTINVTYDDPTGAITFDVIPGGVNHNALLNYVADEHVAHSGVTLTAGVGLAGGGTIAASRTFDLDLNDLTDIGEAVAAADKFGIYNASGSATRSVTYAETLPVVVLASSTGTDTYAATSQFVQSAYRTNRLYLWPCPNNNTGACTINVDTLGAKSMKMQGNLDPVADTFKSGVYYWLLYDGTNMLPVGSSAVI